MESFQQWIRRHLPQRHAKRAVTETAPVTVS
jgi:hypothetical protein